MSLPNQIKRKWNSITIMALIGIAISIILVGGVLWFDFVHGHVSEGYLYSVASQGNKIWVNATDPNGIAWGAAAVRNGGGNSITIDGISVDNIVIPFDNWYVERNQTSVYPNNFISYFNYTANDMHGFLKGTILTGGKMSGTCKVSTGDIIEIDEDGAGLNPPLCLHKENKPIFLESGEKFIIYFRLPNGLLKPVDIGNKVNVTIHGDKAVETTNVIVANPSGRFDVFVRP